MLVGSHHLEMTGTMIMRIVGSLAMDRCEIGNRCIEYKISGLE